ncbi:protein of unknown function (DUF4201) [Carpediemonas membranifera]|uniref:Cilia- and flagella-associated protein 263 n=1 Tax=Carpediemonas membranifera TaxID=201153 RepID=A0A8J6AVG4_9EUKA|nr:protein of unknown function (DUF4201) [Carpediemonas membranifera]|eukprot:KAG9395806.1 protein of unknown function (DUF4201) [Carpediemonas membranifera]
MQENEYAEVEHLRRENALFRSFIKRFDNVIPAESDIEDDENEQPRRKQISQMESSMKPLLVEDKLTIALKEVEDLQEDISTAQRDGEQINTSIRALISAADGLITDTMKEAHDFKRTVIVSDNGEGENVDADRVIKFFTERTKALRTRGEKLKLKNANITRQAGKLKKQLQQKTETGEVLHAIDYDQLKIEHQQHLERIEQKNQELLRLKITSGNTILVLNQLKKQLTTLLDESTWLRAELTAREAVASKLDADIGLATKQQHSVIAVQRSLKQEQHGTNEPRPIDYIKIKAKENDLIKARDNYRRKIEIAEMRVKRARAMARESMQM